MPGLTAVPTQDYEAAINNLLDSTSDTNTATDEAVLQQLSTQNKPNAPVLETALRQEFYRILSTTDIDEDDFERMWRLLDVVNISSDARICDPALLFLLIEDLLESQTIHGCRKVFDYLESRREQLIEKNWVSKHLALLRSCNELLRRLSRAEDTVFCGRVFIFLFQSFPLGDKSSVNLRGEYHTDNITHYEQAVQDATDADAMAVDSAVADTPQAAPKIQVEGKETVDTEELYSTFWSLQEYFAQPTKLFDQSKLTSFKAGLEKTLTKFKEVYREEPRSGPRSDETRGTKRKADNIDAFNPKYLTSRDMFELEIHDPAFRRHILVQSLIVADFLLSQTAKGRAKMDKLRNRSVIYDFVLSDEDAKWASDMRANIASYLQQGTEGKYYYRMVDNVLTRDKNWLRWKAETCPPFSLAPIEGDQLTQAHGSLQKLSAPRQIRKMPMSALDLGFLRDNEDEDTLERYRGDERWNRPELAQFRDDIANTDMDLEMAEGEEKGKLEEQRSSQTWRALRIGGRFSLLDKLDLGERDGLDPLFGILKDSEGDIDNGADGEGPQSTAPSNTLMQVDGTADEPEAASADNAETGADEEPTDNHDQVESDVDEMEDQQAMPEGDEAEVAVQTLLGRDSAESSLSPIESDGPTAENTRVETPEEQSDEAGDEEANDEAD